MDENKAVALDTAATVLYWASVSILIIFCIENLVKLALFGFNYFLLHLLHLLDFMIVAVSLGLTLGITEETTRLFVEFLILLRFWRVIRIINTIVLSMNEKFHLERSLLRKEIENLKQALAQKDADTMF